MSKILNIEDLVALYDKVSSQTKEDREAVNEVFELFRDACKDSPLKMVELGDTLAKILETKIKQTAQTIEIMKVIDKAREKDDDDDEEGLTEEDKISINEQIRKEDGN